MGNRPLRSLPGPVYYRLIPKSIDSDSYFRAVFRPITDKNKERDDALTHEKRNKYSQSYNYESGLCSPDDIYCRNILRQSLSTATKLRPTCGSQVALLLSVRIALHSVDMNVVA